MFLRAADDRRRDPLRLAGPARGARPPCARPSGPRSDPPTVSGATPDGAGQRNERASAGRSATSTERGPAAAHRSRTPAAAASQARRRAHQPVQDMLSVRAEPALAQPAHVLEQQRTRPDHVTQFHCPGEQVAFVRRAEAAPSHSEQRAGHTADQRRRCPGRSFKYAAADSRHRLPRPPSRPDRLTHNVSQAVRVRARRRARARIRPVPAPAPDNQHRHKLDHLGIPSHWPASDGCRTILRLGLSRRSSRPHYRGSRRYVPVPRRQCFPSRPAPGAPRPAAPGIGSRVPWSFTRRATPRTMRGTLKARHRRSRPGLRARDAWPWQLPVERASR